MTKSKRILSFLQGILLFLFVFILLLLPKEQGLTVIAGLFGFSMTLRGLGVLSYYIRMARFMVGGKRVLYTGLIFLDFGIFTAALARSRNSYFIFYIAVLNAFAGLIDLLRARESRKMGAGQWKFEVVYGGVLVLSSIVVVFAEFLLHQTTIALWVYAIGLVFSAFRRIASAFRRTAIVYIQ